MNQKANTGLLTALCVMLSFVAVGMGGLISWALYGTLDFTQHPIPVLAVAGLSGVAGLNTRRLLRWLTGNQRDG